MFHQWYPLLVLLLLFCNHCLDVVSNAADLFDVYRLVSFVACIKIILLYAWILLVYLCPCVCVCVCCLSCNYHLVLVFLKIYSRHKLHQKKKITQSAFLPLPSLHHKGIDLKLTTESFFSFHGLSPFCTLKSFSNIIDKVNLWFVYEKRFSCYFLFGLEPCHTIPLIALHSILKWDKNDMRPSIRLSFRFNYVMLSSIKLYRHPTHNGLILDM